MSVQILLGLGKCYYQILKYINFLAKIFFSLLPRLCSHSARVWSLLFWLVIWHLRSCCAVSAVAMLKIKVSAWAFFSFFFFVASTFAVLCHLRIWQIFNLHLCHQTVRQTCFIIIVWEYLRYFLRLVFSSQVGSADLSPSRLCFLVPPFFQLLLLLCGIQVRPYLWSCVCSMLLLFFWAWAVTTSEQAAPYSCYIAV